MAELTVKVSADTTEVRVLLAKLTREFAEALKDSFFEGWEAANTELQDSQIDIYWQHSEAKKRYDELLSSK